MSRLVDYWGAIYRLSERNYVRFLRAGAAGVDAEPANFGGTFVGVVAFATVHADADAYQERLGAALEDAARLARLRAAR